MSEYLPWRIADTYFESCNCEAICPCRTIGGRRGGRSTYGICFGALSWLVEDGWWTARPLRRRYWEVVTVEGRDLVVFHDLVRGGWFVQR